MTVKRFRKIVDAPADSVPLSAPLSLTPVWPHVVISNVMTYASGQVLQEEMKGGSHTVEGKYVVSAMNSQLYNQKFYYVTMYDAEEAVIKNYALTDNGKGRPMISESRVYPDFTNKTYIAKAVYGDFIESTTGSYTDTNEICKSLIYKNGVLFLTRDLTIRQVAE
jgi:hypothetical protein